MADAPEDAAAPENEGAPAESGDLDLGKTVSNTDPNLLERQLRAELSERKPYLVVLQGEDLGMRYRVDHQCTVGRDVDCDIVLRDDRASKRHANLDFRDGEIHVSDLGSTNGTLVNDRLVAGEAAMAAGDKLFVGSTVMRLDWLDALERGFHEELERLLDIDELTGLLQKRKFDSEGTVLVETTLRKEQAVGVLMLDLDGIKRINDTHGHAFGAHCIAQSGALIGRILRERGIATRWGGDEYSAVLPGYDANAAVAVAEEILAGIRSEVFEWDGIRLRPGISIGVAVGPEQGHTLEALQRVADEALYRAKRTGKGRVSR